MASFDPAITLVLKHEGGYVNDPHDPGGETNYGIAKRSHPDVDIRNLTVDQAKDIYHDQYWSPIQGDDINDQAVANNLLDAAVNTGVRTASKQIQKLAGAKEDGRIGPKSLKAINKTPDLNIRLAMKRVRFYTELARRNSARRRYLVGWITRALSFV